MKLVPACHHSSDLMICGTRTSTAVDWTNKNVTLHDYTVHINCLVSAQLSSYSSPLVFSCRAGTGYCSVVSPQHPFHSCLLECSIIAIHRQIM